MELEGIGTNGGFFTTTVKQGIDARGGRLHRRVR